MKRWKKIFLLLEAFLLMFLLNGCWNYREIERNSIVSGVAIDKGTDGHKYHMTFEVLSLAGGKEQSVKPVLLESDGDTIFDAVRHTVTMADKKLYFSDCKIVIISKELAKEGITPLLDFLLRDHEPRIMLYFLVSDEDTAGEILNTKLQTNEPVAYKISGMLDQSQATLGYVLPTPLYQMYNILSTKDQALTLPDVGITDFKEKTEPRLMSNVIFKQDKMAGIMPKDEGIYYLILKNRISGGVLLTGVKAGQKDVSLDIMKSNAKIEPAVSGKNITMKIHIQMDTSMVEENNSKNGYNLGNGEFRIIEEAASKTVEEGTENVILDMQKNYGADIFGFGEKMKQNDYGDWQKIKPNWDGIYPNVKCEVTADVKILDSATALPKGGG